MTLLKVQFYPQLTTIKGRRQLSQWLMEHNEKVKNRDELLSLIARGRPTTKSSSSFAKLLLLLVIPTILYAWHHTGPHHKKQHLFGKNAEKAFLYVYHATSSKTLSPNLASTVPYPMKPAQFKRPVFLLQSHTQLGHPAIYLLLKIFCISWRQSWESNRLQLNPFSLPDPQNLNMLLAPSLKLANPVHGSTLITLS